MLFAMGELAPRIINNNAKMLQLVDQMDSLSFTTVGILVEDTNNRALLRLDDRTSHTDG
jgi:hypothetical protein